MRMPQRRRILILKELFKWDMVEIDVFSRLFQGKSWISNIAVSHYFKILKHVPCIMQLISLQSC